MDFIEDELRVKYRKNLRELNEKVNPKKYTENERKIIIRTLIEARNKKMMAL